MSLTLKGFVGRFTLSSSLFNMMAVGGLAQRFNADIPLLPGPENKYESVIGANRSSKRIDFSIFWLCYDLQLIYTRV
jgi:hypothetical protein